jgi:hypothetical protein
LLLHSLLFPYLYFFPIMAEWNNICVSSYLLKKGTDVMASQYVSYTVQATHTSEGQSHTVERRFNEFVLLQKEIAKEYPGSIMAPLPKDQVFGRFKPAFIESRMRGLEECLRKLYADSEISQSLLWAPFFTAMSFNEMAVNEAKSKSGAGVTQRRSSWIDTVKNMAAVQLAKPVSYCVVTVLLLCCYCDVTVLLLCCYCDVEHLCGVQYEQSFL